MMSHEDTVNKLALTYSSYIKVNHQSEMQKLDESIEDTLTRLEELESGVKMLQSEREKFGSYDFSAARCNLNALCQRIHKLDEMSKKVLQDVETMEVAVDEAEAHLINSTEGKIKNLLKPLLFMKAEGGPSSQSQMPAHQFTPLQTFKAASFFPKNDSK